MIPPEVRELLDAAEEVVRLNEARQRPESAQARFVLQKHGDNGAAAFERLQRAVRAMYGDG